MPVTSATTPPLTSPSFSAPVCTLWTLHHWMWPHSGFRDTDRGHRKGQLPFLLPTYPIMQMFMSRFCCTDNSAHSNVGEHSQHLASNFSFPRRRRTCCSWQMVSAGSHAWDGPAHLGTHLAFIRGSKKDTIFPQLPHQHLPLEPQGQKQQVRGP